MQIRSNPLLRPHAALPLAGAVLALALFPGGAAAQAADAPLEPREITYDYATGEITYGSPTEKSGAGFVERWVNADQSGRAGFRGGIQTPEEVLDWGVLTKDTGTEIVSRFSFGYATTALDDSIGGPGASAVLRFYDGATGGCSDAGRRPVAEFASSNLLGSIDGLPQGVVVTVLLSGDDVFCLRDGAFGFGFLSFDQTSGGLYDATVPLLCFAGDPAGNPVVDPDAEGQVSLVDAYDPDVETGFCASEFDYGFGVDDASFLLHLEAPDVSGADVASATFRNGSGVNPTTYAVHVPPVLGALFSASDARTNGGTGVLQFGYEDALGGLPLGSGELLIDPSSPNVLAGLEGPYAFDSTGNAAWRLAVPCDLDLCGYAFSTQTLEFGWGLQLKNAQDLVVGF